MDRPRRTALAPGQIGFAASSGPVERYFPIARRHRVGWLAVQISDNRGRVDEHLAIGDGTIRFGRVLAALRRIAFAGPLIIELVDVPKKLRSLRRLRALLR